jgi:hypothetical protein
MRFWFCFLVYGSLGAVILYGFSFSRDAETARSAKDFTQKEVSRRDAKKAKTQRFFWNHSVQGRFWGGQVSRVVLFEELLYDYFYSF